MDTFSRYYNDTFIYLLHLTVRHDGFRKESRAVNVLLGAPGTVNIPLEIPTASSEITVTDEAPLIHAENGDASATMNQAQISEIPNPDNDLTYIVQTAPRAVMNTDLWFGNGGNFSILGMSGTSYQLHPARRCPVMPLMPARS